MPIRIFKTFILLLIVGMVIPIYLFNDNVLKDQAVTQKIFSPCEKINYKLLFYQCVETVHKQKNLTCESFANGPLKASCLDKVEQQKQLILNPDELNQRFQLKNYSPVYLSVLIIVAFLYLIKGGWIKRFPRYQRVLQQVTEVLPESDYFARQSFFVMSVVVVLMGLALVAMLEGSAFVYSFFLLS